MYSVTDIVISASVIAQMGLFIYALVRNERLKTGRFWLPLTLFLMMLSVASRLFLPLTALPEMFDSDYVFVILLAVTFVVSSGLIANDLIKQRGLLLLGAGAFWLVVVLGLSAWVDDVRIGEESGWIVNSLTSFSLPEVIFIAGFVFISLSLLIIAFYVFYVTPLPEVSNRALFWVFNTTLILIGFALAISGPIVLVVLGILILSIGMIAMTYSQFSYRVFDIRNVLGFTVRLVFLITFTALAIFSALMLIDRVPLTDSTERTVLAGTLAIAVAMVYAPTRELIGVVVNRLLMGRDIDAVSATKQYSHELARAIEMSDLVDISSQTLNSVLQVKLSGMLLVSDTSENYIELSVMRGGGLANVERLRIRLLLDSPIYRQIAHKQRPLTQFDIEFDPYYRDIDDSVRIFFRSLEMSVYAPIIMDNALIGLLAAGAKLNDAPIYHHDLELLVSLASQTGVALRNTRLVADLRHLNNTMHSLNSNLGEANDRMGRLDSVKTDFVTIASHELRTPLAQVRGYTDIIDALNDQGMLDQDQTRGLVTNLRKAAERMEELIAAMLDVSQLDVNAMDLRFTQTSPESVLRMAIEPLTDPIKQRKLTLSARGLRGLPTIEADMQRLVQAFRNIITNAIKFTPDGGRIDITASFQQGEHLVTGDYILISIADTGIGVDPEHIELIFNKFYRAADPGLHSTGTYKFMGAGPGLGLTIAKGVIEGHGGRIWVESEGYGLENPKGSTFYIHLPLTPPKNARRVLPFEERNGKK